MPLEHVKLIASLPLFEGLSNEDIERISSFCSLRKHQEGDVLFYEKDTKDAMRQVLKDIQEGKFARDWLTENAVNCPNFLAMRRRGAEHPSEKVGAELRKLYSWNDGNKLIDN